MKKVIYTGNIGGVAYERFSLPLIQAYADRIGAELRVIREFERNENNTHLVLLDCFIDSVAKEEGDRFLWIDLDVVIRPGAPDIFEGRNLACMWACFPKTNKWKRGIKLFSKKHNFADIYPYYNTGMVMWERGHAEKLIEAGADRQWDEKSDQQVLSLLWRRAGVAIRYLPLSVHNFADQQRKAASHFVHPAGQGQKTAKVRGLVENNSPRPES